MHIRYISSAGRKRFEWNISEWSVASTNIDLNIFCLYSSKFFYRSNHYTYNFNGNLLKSAKCCFCHSHSLAPCQSHIILVLGPVFLSLPDSVYPSSRDVRSSVSRWRLDFGSLSFLFLCLFPPSFLLLFHSRVTFCLSAPPDQTLLLGSKISTFVEHYVAGTVLSTLQGLTWLNHTILCEVDITM